MVDVGAPERPWWVTPPEDDAGRSPADAPAPQPEPQPADPPTEAHPGAWRRTGRASVGAVRGVGRGARATARGVRRLTHAQGAGETGLGRLIELHGLAQAADALVAVGLAGTLFFQVPTNEARGRVALYLVLTLAPFALLAPVIGPLLDRVRSGRRRALAVAFVVRGVLALVMAAAVAGAQDPVRLYPAAFGWLVLSRAYGLLRAAAIPRLLPPAVGPVRANGRASLAGLAAATVAAGVGAGLSALVGSPWVLRLAAVVVAVAAYLSLRLPPAADDPSGEVTARISSEREPDRRPSRWNVGPSVVRSLRANASLRAYTGFLTLFLAFLLREHPLPSVSATVGVAAVVAGAGLGSALGTFAGSLLRQRSSRAVDLAVLGASLVTAGLGAWLYGDVVVLALVTGVAGFSQTLGKLSLDGVIQTEVPESVRTSAFARSETVLQLAWALGGGLGIALPFGGTGGLAVAAVGLALALLATLAVHDRAAPASPGGTGGRDGAGPADR